jgi:hypothetical protein
MKIRWSQLGGQAGIGIALAGFVLMFLGWNGAASYNFTPAQFPYLISGGMAGLGLVLVGAAVMIVQGQREQQARTLDALAELREGIERLTLAVASTTSNGGGGGPARATTTAAPGMVVAGPSAYHRPDCRLLDGRDGLPTIAIEEAESQGLTPCRACDPAETATPARRRRR